MPPTPPTLATRVTLLAASSLTVMAGAAIAPSMTALQAAFGGVKHGNLLVPLVMTLPALVVVILSPLVGLALDRWGRRRMLLGSLLIYALAGAAGSLANSLTELLIGRALLGVGMAGVMTGATTLLADYFRGPARDRVMGEQGAFMGLGGVIFLLSAGELAEVSWRLPFLMYGLGLPVVVAGWFFVREPAVEPEPVEGAPGNTEHSAGKARLPWGLILGIYAAGLVGHLAFYFVPVKLDFLIHQQFQGTPRLSGIAIAVITLSSALTALSYGSLQRRASHVTILAATFGLLGIGYVGMGLATSYVVLLVGLTVAGAGLGILIPNLNIWLVGRTPADMRGRLLGGVSMAVFLGQFLSPFISTPLQDGMGIASGFVAAGWVLVTIGAVAGMRAVSDARKRSRPIRQAA